MSISYENQRVIYDKIRIQYKEYLALYKEFNNGSIDGATDFGKFYWRMTWKAKYADASDIGTQGY